MSKQYKTAVVIGRFQPFHNQHAELVLKAAELAEKVVILIGGAGKPRTPKDPFTDVERGQMIMAWINSLNGDHFHSGVAICPIDDYMYSDASWAEGVQRSVNQLKGQGEGETVVVGCNKDESSFYLKMFPQWALHEEPYKDHVDATQIRTLLYEDRSMNFVRGVVPETTFDFLTRFRGTDEFNYVLNEWNVVEKYKQRWKAAPYAPTFVTADAVVIQSGHILLVKRGAAPGYGLMALPGGFLDQGERIVDAVVRELREETRIKVPAPVLKGSIRETAVFDHPKRSARGRTITHASLIVLPDGPLPKVKGSDDAMDAAWYPLGSLKSEVFFEDHYDIIQYFKSRV